MRAKSSMGGPAWRSDLLRNWLNFNALLSKALGFAVIAVFLSTLTVRDYAGSKASSDGAPTTGSFV
jgi:hypothetical protein